MYVVLQPLDKYSGNRTQGKYMSGKSTQIQGTIATAQTVPLVFASCAFRRLGAAFDATGAFKPQVWLCVNTHCQWMDAHAI